ncbi:hypothetical protein D3C85_1389290 [compost metagenome]
MLFEIAVDIEVAHPQADLAVVDEVGMRNHRCEDPHHRRSGDAAAYPALLEHQTFLLFYMHKGTASGSRSIQQKCNFGSQSAVLFL